MKNEMLHSILNDCYFFGIPSENKIWFTTSSLTSSSSSNYPCFYADHFFMEKKDPYIKGGFFFETSYTDLFSLLANMPSQKPEIFWNKIEKDFYLKQFESLKSEIQQRHLLKGVPYTSIKGEFNVSHENKIYLLKKILESSSQQKSLYTYGYWHQNEGLIGITPELLFIQNGKKIKTRAIAGTLPKRESFFKQKIQDEHNFVIEGITASVSHFGTLTMGETSPCVLPNLTHLKTEIEIDLYENHGAKNFSFTEFLRALHPTAALGVLPKNTQSLWLRSFENADKMRGSYAAPFGIIFDQENSICVSTIRGMSWNNGCAKISAGGGVIAESQFTEEWEEINLKINAIKMSLGMN